VNGSSRVPAVLLELDRLAHVSGTMWVDFCFPHIRGTRMANKNKLNLKLKPGLIKTTTTKRKTPDANMEAEIF